MKFTILLLAFFAAVFSSCTSAYKSGQTPDDVYFSPVQPQDEYVQTRQKDNNRYYTDEDYYQDRYLRMKVLNRYRWNDLNDWYAYERYGVGYNYYYGTYYNPYNSWNFYYNPYGYCYGNTAYSTPKAMINKPVVKPRSFNIAAYNNSNYNNTNNSSRSIFKQTKNQPVYNNNNSNSGRGLDNTIRTIFSGNNNNSGRSYSPSGGTSGGSSGNSSGGSSSSGGSRPTRGGNN